MSEKQGSAQREERLKRARDYLNPTETIAKYEFEGENVGGGTFGVVRLGRNRETKEPVAVKRFHAPGQQGSAKTIDVCRIRETNILAALNHPNVIRMIETCKGVDLKRDEGVLYMVMEQGQHDLRGVMDNPEWSPFFTRGQIKGWIQQCLMGLSYCHSRNVMHRDLKPENILLSADGRIKLADFGLAIVEDTRKWRQMTNPVATWFYRAPELLLGARQYTFAVDIWSMGVLAAEFLLNSVLFPGPCNRVDEQLNLIWRVCGTPNIQHDWSQYPEWIKYKPATPIERDLVRRFQTENKSSRRNFFSDQAVDFLDNLLQLDPTKRMPLHLALQHAYLTTESPTPYKPEQMPTYPRSFFGQVEKKLRKSQQQGSNL